MKHLYVALLLLCALLSATSTQAQKTDKRSHTGAAANNKDQIKLTGQIICCEDCWAEEDRTKVPYGTAAHLAQASDCIAGGDPTLLAVMGEAGKTTFYQLEDGKFKRPGTNWLEFVASKVEITGAIRTKKKQNFIKVDELTVLEKPNVQEPKTIGTEAEIVLKDLFGKEQRLSSFKGRIVVLNFWATYCVPCKTEMPDLAAIQNEYAALGVQVIGASAETIADQSKVLQFIKETKLNFPVWLGATKEDMARFGIGPALPGTAIIGNDGKIVWATRGIVKQADLKAQLEKLLNTAKRESKTEIAKAKKEKPSQSSSVPS